MITYTNRYSDTDEPDKHGRWAREVYCNGFRIGWICLIRGNVGHMYSANCHFPTNGNDSPTEGEVFLSPEGAKAFIAERWEYFLSVINEAPTH